MKTTHVALTYFRKTGKYYAGGEIDLPYNVDKPLMFHETLQQVVDLLNSGQRPGLVDGMGFDVLVTVYTEYGPLPHLFVRDVDGYVGQRSLRVKQEDPG